MKKNKNLLHAGNQDSSAIWIKPDMKNTLTEMATKVIHEVDDQWEMNDSAKLVNAFEKLLYPLIDTNRLFLGDMEHMGGSFNFNVVQNVLSDELLDLILEYYPERWQIIRNIFMKDGCVDFVYEDRYVNSPLGCIMLAQFIRRIKDLFRLRFRSITLCLSKRDYREMFDDSTLKIDRKFSHVENRDSFLQICMNRIVREPYEINLKNVKHTRTLSIRNDRFELEISPEGGISYGWGIENGKDNNLTIDQLMDNVDRNIHCYNRAAHSYDRRGIRYTVKLIPL